MSKSINAAIDAVDAAQASAKQKIVKKYLDRARRELLRALGASIGETKKK